MNSTIDDIVLINQFLEGNGTPLFNRNLIIQTNSNSVQLHARGEGVVATIQRVHYTQTISLRSNATYYELIREMLIKRHFLPMSTPHQTNSGFEQYRRHQIPDGYVMNYTEAKLLWREWRFTWHERNTNRLRRGILLLSRDNWYPIQDIGFHQGLLVVRTLVSAITVQPNEQVIWLSQTHESARAKVGSKEVNGSSEPVDSSENRQPKMVSSTQMNLNKQLASAIASAAQSRPLTLAS